ncbi:hypothetical protein MRX96_021555 [Rhipicephalus microplus]
MLGTASGRRRTNARLNSLSFRTRCSRSLHRPSRRCSQTLPPAHLHPHCMTCASRYPTSPIPSQQCRAAAHPRSASACCATENLPASHVAYGNAVRECVPPCDYAGNKSGRH